VGCIKRLAVLKDLITLYFLSFEAIKSSVALATSGSLKSSTKIILFFFKKLSAITKLSYWFL